MKNIDHITISMRKSPYFEYLNNIIGTPICVENEFVGIITDMDDEYIYGDICADKWKLIDTKTCSFEFTYGGEIINENDR